VALLLADQRTGDRRRDRDQPVLDVGLVLAHDLIAHRFAVLDIDEMHGRNEYDAAIRVDLRDVDDLRVRELRLDISNAGLDQTLLLFGGVVLRILTRVAVSPRLRNCSHHPRALLRLETLQLLSELLGPARRQWNLTQTAASSCRSCNRLTIPFSRWSTVSLVALPAGRVV